MSSVLSSNCSGILFTRYWRLTSVAHEAARAVTVEVVSRCSTSSYACKNKPLKHSSEYTEQNKKITSVKTGVYVRTRIGLNDQWLKFTIEQYK